jgi:folate-dependent phosphoribosylglycinamide formyltransferase PurN
VNLKIGLLLDSWSVPVWQKQIIDFIHENPSLSLKVIILNASEKKHGRRLPVYKFLRKIDRSLFRVKHDCFKRVDIQQLLSGIPVHRVMPNQSKFTDEFKEQDVDAIQTYQLDVLVRFGFRILKGNILRATTQGVWSLHHGDNDINRGGPPAFWEVVNKEPVTGVTLLQLSNDLDGGAILGKAFTKTDLTSFNRNQNTVYWSGVELFCSTLARLALSEKLMAGSNLKFYSKSLYRDPRNVTALSIFAGFWLRRTSEAVSGIFKKQQWALHYKAKKDGFESSLFRYKVLKPPPGIDWADPFLIKRDGKYYIFFEELVKKDKKAHISLLIADENGKFTSVKPATILEEPYHLSYPFLLEYENNLYMLPEAAAGNAVWIYKCEKFPGTWVKHKKLLSDVALYDPTLHHHNGKWYLFGTQKPFEGNVADQYLFIYVTDDLFEGQWRPHAKNPVTRDVRGARPAGRIFEHAGKWIRPSQIGAPKYGYGIQFHEITQLTPDDFEERPAGEILPHWQQGLRACHTFNFNDGFSIVDGQM